MRIDILTCAPELLDSFFVCGVIRKGIEKGVIEVVLHDLRDYGVGRHSQIDDEAYGGEPGMVLKLEPIVACIEKLQGARHYDELICMTPEGATLDQQIADELATRKAVLVLCGHYKGVDERLFSLFPAFRKISIGNYILPGGELPAALLVHAVLRLVPDTLHSLDAALNDSFQEHLISSPVYTRPAVYRGHEVPEVLRSGHAAKIAQWRRERAQTRSQEKRKALEGELRGLLGRYPAEK